MLKGTLFFVIASSISEPGALMPPTMPDLGAYSSMALGLVAVILARRHSLGRRG